MPRTTRSASNPEETPEVLDGQTAIDDTKKDEAQPQTQIVLYSKGDVAEKLGLTTQALANRVARDPDVPRPTYTNQSGTVELYTADDVKRVGAYLLRPSEDIAKRINAALKDL